MKAGVSKKEFVAKFEELLKLTRENIEGLSITDNNDEILSLRYTNGHEVLINVACDSGTAIIRDVARRIN